jgi:hypothetical protein
LKSELVRLDFLFANAVADMVTARTHPTTEMNDAVLNSGINGLGDGDAVGETVGETVGV